MFRSLHNLFLQNTVCADGWPLSIHGAVVLHLGTLDECVVTASDLYLCIRPPSPAISNSNSDRVNLCAVWRQFETDKIVYHILDPDKDPVTSIALEMLTEELPQLLQTLLVSVEQTINRIPFDDLSFPSSSPPPSPAATAANDDFVRKLSQQNVASPNGSPKCGLKRRELITRNHKTLHGRYAMRRMSLNKSENESSSTSSPMHSNSSTIKESNAMPLFCLGGSFPHIDSDEDSGADDASKSSSERKLDNFALEIC